MAANSTEDRAQQLAKPADETDAIFKVIRKFVFKSFAWFGIYILGYYDFSIAWLLTPLLLTVLREQWKKERDYKLTAARQAALTNEKTMIESRIKPEDLPSWVFFPDKERAEWINNILQQLWPNVGNYVRKVIAESVEPAVRTALDGYNLTGFKFEKVVLGQIPPRVTGIKVYDKNTNRNEIIMDTDLIFASDCDIKFSLKGFTAKISDFSLKGLVRVVFKPLITDVPLIGGIQVYFLTNPDVDFDLGGIANALDAPGLSDIIRKIVVEQLGAFMVLPNKFTMSLAETVENKQLKCPDTAGVLRVQLKRAEKLEKKDIGVLGMGKSDPYATLSVGARTLKTHKINNSVNPEWNFIGDFPIEVVHGQQLMMEIFDHDDPGSDEFLGRATIATGLVANKGEISDMWVNLEDAKTGRALLSLSWMPVSSSSNDIDMNKGQEDLAKCLLHVYVDSCKDLIQKGKKPSPIVDMWVGAGDSQSTWPQQHTMEPVFEQGFVFLVNNPMTDDLHVKVVDSAKSDNKDKQMSNLGILSIPISDIIKRPGMEYHPPQPFVFQDGHQGTITLSVELKALKKAKAERPPTPLVCTPDERPTPADLQTPAKGQVGIPDPDVSMSSTESSAEKKSIIIDTPQPPSLDEAMANTIEPIIKSAGVKVETAEVVNPELRKRNNVAAPFGKVKISLTYNQTKEELDVIVHEATGLPGGDLPDPPDPYVKMYLLPQRSKKSKRKSDAKKDTVNPVYDESFQYDDMSVQDMREQKLEVSVVDRKGIFARRALMGRANLDLFKVLESNGSLFNEWLILEEDDEDSD